jgi:hypothetical protein
MGNFALQWAFLADNCCGDFTFANWVIVNAIAINFATKLATE